VVQTADQIGVEFSEGKIIPARVIASEPMADVALLQLEFTPSDAVVVKLGDSDAMRVGDEVFVIGAPYGISRSLTAGHISARHVVKGSGGIGLPLELFQTDASINSGNSGGPMFNVAGEVVGIVSYILSQSGGFEGLGFAVTSNVAQKVLLGEKSPWTGMEAYLLSDDLAKIFNVPQPYGVLVQRIAEGSPAARIGLRGGKFRAKIGDEELLVGGDIILEVGGIPVAPDAYKKTQAYFLQLQPGDEIVVKVLREGKVMDLKTYKIRR
jgi:S1-C subfamily serine protease